MILVYLALLLIAQLKEQITIFLVTLDLMAAISTSCSIFMEFLHG